MIMDSIAEHLNRKRKKPSWLNVQHKPQMQFTSLRSAQDKTHTHTYTTVCTPLLTQALQVLFHATAAGPTQSAVHSLSLRVMTLSLNQTHTTTGTMIKQTSSQTLSIAYLCTTSLVESN